MLDEMSRLRHEIEAKKKQLEQMEQQYFDINGVWKVTTEGDCEGRSTKDLGTHQGNLFDIVKQLSSQAYYQLSVRRVGYSTEIVKKRRRKEVQFNVEDKTIKIFDKKQQLDRLLPHVPEGHALTEGNYYGAVKLEWD